MQFRAVFELESAQAALIGGYTQLLSTDFQGQADMFQMWVNLFLTDAQGPGQRTGILRIFFQ